MLTIVGATILVSTLLIVLAPQIGTLLLEIAAGMVLVIRGSVLRARVRRASQLCLQLRGPTPGVGRFRFLDRYELLLIIAAILTYGSLSGFLRSRGTAEAVARMLPLVLFGVGLLAKPMVLRWIANRRTAAAAGAAKAVSARSDS
jgi:hypothetical protein